MKLDKVAWSILLTAVCNYRWFIKCGECNIGMLTCQSLAFCFTFMTGLWWLPSFYQANAGKSSNNLESFSFCLLKTKLQSNMYGEGI
jgi:hypothetical protein